VNRKGELRRCEEEAAMIDLAVAGRHRTRFPTAKQEHANRVAETQKQKQKQKQKHTHTHKNKHHK
jgi:hypothetical protein